MVPPRNPNPWSFEGWNITDQGTYVNQYGSARAAARARDAGAVLGGPRPLPPGHVLSGNRKFAEVAIVRPENPPIYRFAVMAKRENIRVIDTGEPRATDTGDARAYKD